jgi:hypothetical protein
MTSLERLIGGLPAQLRKQSHDAAPKISAENIVRCYRVALGELTDPSPLDPHSRAAAIVRAYRRACGEVVEEPDAAPPVKVTAFEPVAKSHHESEQNV